ASVRRRGGGCDGHSGAWRVKCQGRARARVDAALPQLAHGIPGRLLGDRGCGRTDAASCRKDEPFDELDAHSNSGANPGRPARPPGATTATGGPMTAQAQETSVRTQITIQAPIERAFKVFTADFGRFKPLEHNLLGVEIAETVFEPRAGGRLYDRGVD